jgi:hypothetical protein
VTGSSRGGRGSARSAATLALAVGLALGACSSAPSAPSAPSSSSSSPEGSATPPPADLVSPVTGVLTHIDASGLSQVAGFTLRLDDGREIGFRIGVLENGSVFPPGHLVEHFQAFSPIRVSFRRDGDALVVYRLEDAASASPG